MQKNAKKSKVGRTDRPTDRPTDRQTDRPTDTVTYRVACTRLKSQYASTLVYKYTGLQEHTYVHETLCP